MRKQFLTLTVLMLATASAAADRMNPADLRRVTKAREHIIPAVAKEFGPRARFVHLFGQGKGMLAGVVAEVPAEPLGTDDVPLLAIVQYDEDTGAVRVVDREFKYREARTVGRDVALLDGEGNLRLREANGRERLLAQGVGGDLFPTAKGDALVATLIMDGQHAHETSVGLIDLKGRVKVLADGPGVDATPSISPDGRTVVFVSGRTTVASFYVTTVDGGAPRQLTNVGLDSTMLFGGPPKGFVPPPVSSHHMEWVSEDVLRYNAGGGEFWKLNVRTGEAAPDLGGEK
ncbi:PD40 domain-containing protein [Pyxidicoccus parkwayensis]|uniref:PD40 domain-containing protein n=1 Tax=Pyxidicoccus parkwayensis TaxID=2813578 RepID=A0ABX7NXG0_9BACT|nr:PD40 domain-containing protein [Pyxidicoccus parkwaysis]QSQ23064.1 PD40 domain-containing protein [Pyxidicoccus parkwaysis]